jgi:hypothetical protein
VQNEPKRQFPQNFFFPPRAETAVMNTRMRLRVQSRTQFTDWQTANPAGCGGKKRDSKSGSAVQKNFKKVKKNLVSPARPH